MKTLLLAFVLYSGIAYGQIGFGISIFAPPPPRVEVIVPQPGPDFYWIDGYWYPVRGRYFRHEGYWSRPVYPGARWIGPRHDGRSYYRGYWEGDRGRVFHEHRWDRDRGRDFGHFGHSARR